MPQMIQQSFEVGRDTTQRRRYDPHHPKMTSPAAVATNASHHSRPDLTGGKQKTPTIGMTRNTSSATPASRHNSRFMRTT